MIFRILFKIIKTIKHTVSYFFTWIITWCLFKLNGVKFKKFVAKGYPVISVNLKGSFNIGNNLMLNSGKYANMIGRQQQCYFIVGPNAILTIGDNVGISSTAIICYNKISIGNNVKVGGNVVIYDNDFHSLNSAHRNSIPEDFSQVISKPVIIKDNVFIGAHVTILKGVTIGENAIIGAGAVVSKNIPGNEIWGGNPAKYIGKAI